MSEQSAHSVANKRATLVQGLPNVLAYDICMHWIELQDFARLEIALCSTTALLDTIRSAGNLKALNCTSRCGQSSSHLLAWATERQISVQSLKLSAFVTPSSSFVHFLLFGGDQLVDLTIEVDVQVGGYFGAMGRCIALHCANLQTLSLRNCNLEGSIREIFERCQVLHTLSLDSCVGDFDIYGIVHRNLRCLLLRNFRLVMITRDSTTTLQAFPAPFPGLQTLELCYTCATRVSDAVVALLAGGVVIDVRLVNVWWWENVARKV
jgi:hypothetical protein